MDAYRLLVIAHIAAGSVALVSFWIAAFARKGGPLHKRVGKAYLLAMLGVLASALPMALVFIARGRINIGVFLGYLVVITGTSVWLGWRAIQLKRNLVGYHDPRFKQVAIANLIAGLAVFGFGLQAGSALLSGFSWVGIIIGISMLRQLRTLPTARNWWLREHYRAMLGNGVATHVAFLGIGLNGFLSSFGIPMLQLVPWFAPLVVAGIASVYLDRRYGAANAVGAGNLVVSQ